MNHAISLAFCTLVICATTACGTSQSGGGTSAGAASTASGSSGGASGSAGATGGSDAGGAHVGQTCNPQATSDLCLAEGLICDAATSTCQLPSELQLCLDVTGCDDAALTCLPGFGQSQHGPGTTSLCVRPCAHTSDCPQLFTNCQKAGIHQFCFYDHCGPDGGYYGPCDSEGTSDGTCLPFPALGIGFCFAAGAQPAGGSCAGTRTDAGVGQLCQPGLACSETSPTAGHVISACVPLCDKSGDPNGPRCGTSDLCISNPGSGFGSCLENCGSGTTGTCPKGLTCQDILDDGVTVAVCLPE